MDKKRERERRVGKAKRKERERLAEKQRQREKKSERRRGQEEKEGEIEGRVEKEGKRTLRLHRSFDIQQPNVSSSRITFPLSTNENPLQCIQFLDKMIS